MTFSHSHWTSSLLEFGHSICLCHAFYIMTIIHFGRVDMLVKPPDSLKISILFSSTLPALVQVSYQTWSWINGINLMESLFHINRASSHIEFTSWPQTITWLSSAGLFRFGDLCVECGLLRGLSYLQTSFSSLPNTNGLLRWPTPVGL